ncbi:MAG: peptidase [Parcubacteria group bacterium]|nr:peptidase [Parcubacteria group bacterium]
MEIAIFGIVVLIFSIIVHEVAHGYAANALGDPTAKLQGRLTLNPLPHIDLIGSIIIPAILVLTHSGFLFGWAKPVPYNPYNLKNRRWGEAIVGVAGVATNLIIAVVFAFVTRFAAEAGNEAFANLAAIVTLTNLYLGLFNLVPIPPLDGFTVLRGILPFRASQSLAAFEEKLQAGGILTLIVILFLFSHFLAAPFSILVQNIFVFLVGV